MGNQPSADDYDHVTSNHAEIKEVVQEWDARPAITDGEEGSELPALRFEEKGGDTKPVHWGEFFDQLDRNGLALAYRESGTDDDGAPAEYEFVSAADEPTASDNPAASQDPNDQTIDKPNEEVADRRSEIRGREAEKEENIDNHRDREPFQS